MLPEQLKSRSSHLFSHCLMYNLIRLGFSNANWLCLCANIYLDQSFCDSFEFEVAGGFLLV